MKISNGKKLFTLYKKDLAASKFESLLILGFILAANLFLYYKSQTSWPSDISLVFSIIILGFVPLITFFRAFSFIRNEWKENTVYFMMSLPTKGNTIFLSKLLALLTQFFILGAVAIGFTISFVLMKSELQQIWLSIKGISNSQQIIWEISKIGIIISLGFGSTIIMAFFSAVVGKLFKRFSGLITFAVFLATNYVGNNLLIRISGLANSSEFNSYMERRMLAGTGTVSWQILPNLDFIFMASLIIAGSVLLFLGTTAIYDTKVEL